MATRAAAVAARPATVVVVDPSAVGGDSGAGEAASPPPAGSEPEGPPAIVATDRAVLDAGLTCDTATSVSTMVTPVNATISAFGDNRRIHRRCTDLTSLPPGGRRERLIAPDPSR
jgi:hypothetical protein